MFFKQVSKDEAVMGSENFTITIEPDQEAVPALPCPDFQAMHELQSILSILSRVGPR